MKKKILLMLFFSVSFATQSQTFSAGGGIGVNSLVFSDKLEYGSSIYLYGSIVPSELFEIELRPGIFLSKNYFGIETGGYLKIFPFNNLFFLVAGLNLHWNRGEQSINVHTRNDLFTLPVIGFGLRGLGVKHKTLTIELAFQKPYPDGLSYRYSYYDFKVHRTHDFKAIFSLNLALIYQLN